MSQYFQKLVTVTELQELTGWSKSTIYRYLKTEKLEAKKDYGGHWLINYLSIPTYLRRRQNDRS